MSDANFIRVGFEDQGVVDERQLKLLVRDWRKGRATRSIWDALTDGYVWLFSVTIIVAMVVSGLLQAQRSSAGCTAVGCVTARDLTPWLMVAGSLLVTLTLSRMFGPVVASSAEGFWMMDAPLRRSRLLQGRLWGIVLGTGALGALLGALVSMVTGSNLREIALWAAATGLCTAAMTALAAAEQGLGRVGVIDALRTFFGVVTVVVLLGVIGTGLGWFTLPVFTLMSAGLSQLVMAVAAVVLLVSAVVARRHLDGIARARLVSGGSLLGSMQGAAFALDFALMRDILLDRRWYEVGHVKVARGGEAGLGALRWRELQRLRRNPRPLAMLVVALVVPYALQTLGMGRLVSTLSALVLLFVLIPFFDSLRILTRDKGLARCFPFSTSELRDAVTALPLLMAIVWGVLSAPAFLLGSDDMLNPIGILNALLFGVMTGVAGGLGAMRWVSASSPDYNLPMVATGAGALPPGLLVNLTRGLDIVAIVTLPLLVGWSPWIAVLLASILWAMLRSNGINREELFEASAQSRREMEEAQAASGGKPKQKIVVPRSRPAGTAASSGSPAASGQQVAGPAQPPARSAKPRASQARKGKGSPPANRKRKK